MAMLGDFEIMRGSYMFRYWGKNSMLIQSELRFPVFGSESVQGVIFTDIGRVADEYKLKELFTDMNYNGGAGIRYYFNKDILLRADFGISDEGFQVRSNLGQAF
jgi:outer membrane protein assembly factor BamA